MNMTIPKIAWPEEWGTKGWWSIYNNRKPLTTSDTRQWNSYGARLLGQGTSLREVRAELCGEVLIQKITLAQLKQEVKARGIDSQREYKARYKEISGAPSQPHTYPEWVSWLDLFGRGAPPKITLAQLKQEVKDIGITSQREYLSRYREITGAPASPSRFYVDFGWISWHDLFGRDVHSMIPLVQLKEEVKDRGISSCTKYKATYQEIRGAPSNPDIIYPDWVSWPDLFGRKIKSSILLAQLKEEVKDRGISSKEEYYNRYKEIPGAPSAPNEVYASGWAGWPDLFGRKVETKITLAQLKEEVKRLRIDSQRDYYNRYREIPGAPSLPSATYADAGWVSWPDLFCRDAIPLFGRKAA